MRKMTRLLTVALSLVLGLGLFAGCNANKETVLEKGKHYSDLIAEAAAGNYDDAVFRINKYGMPKIADPSVLYVDDANSKFDGKFLVSGTTSNTAYDMFYTDDFVTYKFAATAFRPREKSWGKDELWASEYVYDEQDGLYYLFYSAVNRYARGEKPCRELNVAVAEKPEGPYLEYNEYALLQSKPDATQAEIEAAVANPAFEQAKWLEFDVKNVYADGSVNPDFFAAIDPHPFVDPQTGDRYLYFCRDQAAGIGHTWLYGVKMTDWHTPEYSTLIRLFGTDDGGYEGAGNPTTEGPFMTYNPTNRKYYVTFSVNDYNASDYCVAQAVADSPLGGGLDGFTKIKRDKGGLVIVAGDSNGKVSGSGHHSFFTVNGQMYAIYHRHSNPATGGTERELAVDTVGWVTNPDGLPVLHLNGCTTTLQPRVGGEYGNLALAATVTATGSYQNLDAVHDGIVVTHAFDSWIDEFVADGDAATVKFDFGGYKTVAAVLAYNSIDAEKTFEEITAIRIHARVDGKEGIYRINNLEFDPSLIEGGNAAVQGSAAIAAFAPMEADWVEIVFNKKYSNQDAMAISELVILGK